MMNHETEKVVNQVKHITTFHHPPPKRTKESAREEAEMEFGIFPDTPDARLLKEFADVHTSSRTTIDLSEASIYITADELKWESTSARATQHQQLLALDDNLDIKTEFKVDVEESESHEKINSFNPKSELKEELRINMQDSLPDKGLGSNTSIVPGPGEVNSSDCPYCEFKNKSSASTSTSSMETHLVRFHPEHYLIDEKDKSEGLWHEQFGSILTKMVYPNYIVKTGPGPHRSCSLCGTLYNANKASVNLIELKKHLIFNHKTELKEKFRIVLKDPSFEERLNSCNDSLTKKKIKVRPEMIVPDSDCPYCVFNCGYIDSKKKSSLEKHLVQWHPEHFLLDQSERDKIRREHVQTIFKEILLPNFIKTTTSTTSSGQRKCVSCSLCGEEFKRVGSGLQNVYAVSEHLLSWHKIQLKEELRVLVEEVFAGESPSLGTQSSSKCPYCRFQYNSSSSSSTKPDFEIQRHLVLFHPEHFLIEGKEMPNGVLGLKYMIPGFRMILTAMIFPKLISIIGLNTKCLLCQMKYTAGQKYENIVSARKHLMLKHKAELTESVKVVVEDPLREEKLASAYGVSCSCGIYFSHSERAILSYHKKFHCILEPNEKKP